jgi:hypothetical protein
VNPLGDRRIPELLHAGVRALTVARVAHDARIGRTVGFAKSVRRDGRDSPVDAAMSDLNWMSATRDLCFSLSPDPRTAQTECRAR